METYPVEDEGKDYTPLHAAIENFLYALRREDLIDHLDCWEEEDWEKAWKAAEEAGLTCQI